MISKIIAWLVSRWSSAAASNILVIVLALVAVSGVYYVKGLQVKVAKCHASTAAQERYNVLADRLAVELEKGRDEIISSIENAPDNDCIDSSVGELLHTDE